MLEATRQEIAILRQVMGHPYISKFKFKIQIYSQNKDFKFLKLIWKQKNYNNSS